MSVPQTLYNKKAPQFTEDGVKIPNIIILGFRDFSLLKKG